MICALAVAPADRQADQQALPSSTHKPQIIRPRPASCFFPFFFPFTKKFFSGDDKAHVDALLSLTDRPSAQ